MRRQVVVLAFNEPLVPAVLIALCSLAQIIVQVIQRRVLLANFVGNCRTPELDANDFVVEFIGFLLRIPKMRFGIVRRAGYTPEQVARTGIIKLLK